MRFANISINNSKFPAELADTFLKRIKGLSGRSPKENIAMLFVFPSKSWRVFWMKGMKFPLDIVWIEDDKVVGIERNIPIPSGLSLKKYRSPQKVNLVLELPAGITGERGINVNDKIVVNC